MKKVKWDNLFYLSTDMKQPFVHKLKNENYYSQTVSLDAFLQILPVVFHRSFSQLSSKQTLHGESWRNRGFLGFVSDEQTKPIDYLQHLQYHQYSQLKEDLKSLNPYYRFAKKSHLNLDQSSVYLQEAVKDLSSQEVLKKASRIEDAISFEDFHAYFHCINKKKGYYAIPFEHFSSLGSFYEATKKYTYDFPIYRLELLGIDTLLFYKNEQFYWIKNNPTFSYSVYSKEETEQLIQEINLFFSSIDPEIPISIYALEKEQWSRFISTTAQPVSNFIGVKDDFTFLRQYFHTLYQVKARGKQELWEKGIPKIKETPLSFDFPLFSQMGNSTSTESIEGNQEIIQALQSSDPFIVNDAYIKLIALEQDRVFSDEHPFSDPYTTLFSSTKQFFMMPDYGKIAKNSPSFDDIIKEKA